MTTQSERQVLRDHLHLDHEIARLPQGIKWLRRLHEELHFNDAELGECEGFGPDPQREGDV